MSGPTHREHITLMERSKGPTVVCIAVSSMYRTHYYLRSLETLTACCACAAYHTAAYSTFDENMFVNDGVHHHRLPMIYARGMILYGSIVPRGAQRAF